MSSLCCYANNISVLDLSNCPALLDLLHTTERQEGQEGNSYYYEWGALNSGFLKIDRATLLPDQLITLTLLSSIIAIEEEAFANLSCQAVIIPKGCTSIGERAFAGCSNLIYVKIPASATSYPDNAFEGCNENLVIEWEGH